MASKAILLTSQFNQQLMWLLATATGFHFSKTWICFIFLSLQGRFFFFCFLLFFWQPLWSEQPRPKCTPNTHNNRKDRRFLCSHWFGLNEECDYSHLGMLMIIWLKPRFFSFPKLICYCCQHVLEDIFWYFSVCICHIYWRDSGNTVSGKPMDSFRKPVLHVCSWPRPLRLNHVALQSHSESFLFWTQLDILSQIIYWY